MDALREGGRRDNLDALPSPECHRIVHGDIRDGQLVAHLLREYRIDTLLILPPKSTLIIPSLTLSLLSSATSSAH